MSNRTNISLANGSRTIQMGHHSWFAAAQRARRGSSSKDDPKTPSELAAAAHFTMRSLLEMDGTCTGEHGIGLGKREALAAEFGAGSTAANCQITPRRQIEAVAYILSRS